MTVTDKTWFGKLDKGWYCRDPDVFDWSPIPAEFKRCLTTINLV